MAPLESLRQGLLVLYSPMPSIKLSVPHKLGVDEAKRRISKLMTETQKQFSGVATDVTETWNGTNASIGFKAMGMPVSGSLAVQATEVQVEIDLPFAALPFKGQVERELSSRAKLLLA